LYPRHDGTARASGLATKFQYLVQLQLGRGPGADLHGEQLPQPEYRPWPNVSGANGTAANVRVDSRHAARDHQLCSAGLLVLRRGWLLHADVLHALLRREAPDPARPHSRKSRGPEDNDLLLSLRPVLLREEQASDPGQDSRSPRGAQGGAPVLPAALLPATVLPGPGLLLGSVVLPVLIAE
jgi:hypothetical protein